MTGYQIALFIHLLALLAAATASGVLHLSVARAGRAKTLGQSLEWGRLAGSVGRVFPIAVLLLVLSGGYMVSGHWTWRLPWVDAGATGALLLLASGATLGRHSAVQARAKIARLQSAGPDAPNDPPDRLIAILSNANAGLAIGIVFAMTAKPGAVGSILSLAIGAGVGALMGMSHVKGAATGVVGSERAMAE